MNMMIKTEEKIELVSLGKRLKGILSRPKDSDNRKRPLVILMHGFSAYKEAPVYEQITNHLLSKGLAVLRFDFNGHGQSEGLQTEMTVLNELEDARVFYEYAKKLEYVSKIIFAGHSQGGLLAGLFAAELGEKEVPYLIQFAPAGGLKDAALSGYVPTGNRSDITENEILNGVQLFDPEHMPEEIAVHPFYTVGKAYYETLRSLSIFESASTYKGKVLLLMGTEDGLVLRKYTNRYAASYDHCKYVIIEGEDHDFLNHLDKSLEAIDAYLAENNLIQK